MQHKLENDLFLKACRGEATPRTPIWIMRQAGRYLPEYRAVREKHNFLTMVKTPELAAEVTVQPIDLIGVDAAILFSDIMTVPEAMGMSLEMVEGRGPVLADPIRNAADVKRLGSPDPHDELRYVVDAVTHTRAALAGRVPLIGFSGSPWTLFAYMVEGSGSKQFRFPKAMAFDQPELAHEILGKIADVVAGYLAAQVGAGADAVQIFDTWGGILPARAYREFSLAYITRVVERVAPLGAPVIVFSKDCAHSLDAIAQTGCSVVGVDWGTDMGTARAAVGNRVALQGNLDPAWLFASEEKLRGAVVDVLSSHGNGAGHIFNLGHGIWPDTPVENVRALVRIVAEESPRFHTREDSRVG